MCVLSIRVRVSKGPGCTEVILCVSAPHKRETEGQGFTQSPKANEVDTNIQ